MMIWKKKSKILITDMFDKLKQILILEKEFTKTNIERLKKHWFL